MSAHTPGYGRGRAYSMDVYHPRGGSIGLILHLSNQCWIARTTDKPLGAFRSKKNAIAAVYRAALARARGTGEKAP